MYAIQGAMAIRRQRQLRENRRLSQIRISKNGGKGSASPRGSDAASTADAAKQHQQPEDFSAPAKTETSQTAFYLGVVFILLGFLMIFSSMISSSATETDWSRLLGVGVTFLIVGLVMVMVNRIITAREEEELTRYVSHRLGRSRSGHALVRDTESGEDLHYHLQKHHGSLTVSRQGLPPKSPRPSRSPRDKPVDPFPKFRQGSQVSTRAGSARTSPVTPNAPLTMTSLTGRHVRSASHHSIIGSSSTSNHGQNGKTQSTNLSTSTLPTSGKRQSESSTNIPVVVVDGPTSSTVSNEEASRPNVSSDNNNSDVPFSCDVIIETETLLKKSTSFSTSVTSSSKKTRNKKHLNNSVA